MFGAIKSGMYKGKVKGKLIKKLDIMKEQGLIDLDPFRDGAAMVDSIWRQSPDVFEGKLGARPDEDLAMAWALGNALTSNYDFGRNRNGLCVLFFHTASKLSESNKRFSGVDLMLIEGLGEMTKVLKSEIEDHPLAEDIERQVGAD